MNPKLLWTLGVFTLFLESGAQDTKYIQFKKLDVNEFREVREYLTGAQIIAMGESTHGTHEFFVSRIHLFQYLVEELDFNTFFLEADYSTCLPINNYIHGGPGDATKLVKGIGLWPWATVEMVELVEWMKNYNASHPDRELSFIGVDVQKFEETCEALAHLAGTKAPETLVSLSRMRSQDFLAMKKSEMSKMHQSVLRELDAMDMSTFNEEDAMKFKGLVRNLDQVMTYRLSKQRLFRDYKMAENILYHLSNDITIKGFFWGHNEHIANFYNVKKKSGVAGGMLKQTLKDKYYSIGQEFYEGSFNVYYAKRSEGNNKTREGYVLGSVTVGPAAEGSLAHNFKKEYELPLFIPFSELPESEQVNITDIGSRYVLNDNPKSIWRFNHHGKSAFDALLLIDKSSPTSLLPD